MFKKLLSALLVLTMTLGIITVTQPKETVTVSAREWPGRPGGNWGNGDSLTIGGLKYGERSGPWVYVGETAGPISELFDRDRIQSAVASVAISGLGGFIAAAKGVALSAITNFFGYKFDNQHNYYNGAVRYINVVYISGRRYLIRTECYDSYGSNHKRVYEETHEIGF